MNKLLLLNFAKKKDYVLKSALEEMGYVVFSLPASDLVSTDKIHIMRDDIVFYSYDEVEFNTNFDALSGQLNTAPFIFVVKNCSTALFCSMSRISNSWYLKEPFEKNELDFIIRMASLISSVKISKNGKGIFASSLLDGTLPENIDFSTSDDGMENGTAIKKINGMEEGLSVKKRVLDIAYEHAPTLILLIDQDYRVEDINQIGVETLGKNPEGILGLAVGDIFSCVNSFEDGGCGTHPDCVTCSMRNIIADAFRLGSNFHKIEGSMDTLGNDGVVSSNKFLISTAYVGSQDNNKVLLYLDDITERKKDENTLKESEERFQTLYENMPGGMIIIGKDYVIEDVNHRTCEITGYGKEELVGQLCDIVCPKGSLSKKCPIWIDCLDGFQGMDTAIKCKNGTKTPILKNAKKIFIEGEQYILENFQDISGQKDAEEAIIKAKIIAEEANRTKSEFLATMSHELRTPLNAVIGYSDLLLEESFGVLGSQQKKSLNHISNSGRHLLKLINDILDISKVESGKMELYCEDFFASEVFMTVLDIVSPLARKKNIKLESSIVPENLLINADRVRFKQILFNLASNAIKFTPDGGHILLKAHKKNDVMEFSVIDTGIGISSADVGRLFLPFQQIDSGISREYNGTGLGLSLVKKFVEMHNGEVSVESEPGQGSNFSFSIPLDMSNSSLS